MTTTTKKKQNRRTPDQIIADLEAKIAQVQARAKANEAKQKPEVKPFLVAVKATDKAIEAAQSNAELLRALEAARATMSEQLVSMGLRLPDRQTRKRARASAG